MTVPDAELAVLDALWDEAPRTVRGLADALYDSTAAGPVATVQTLLGRLEEKSLVVRDRTAKAHTFTAALTREAFAGAELAGLAERLSDGSLTPLLTHLVETRRLRRAELDELRRLLDAAPPRRPARRSPVWKDDRR